MSAFKIIENAGVPEGSILAVFGAQAWIFHNGDWHYVRDYAARVTAILDRAFPAQDHQTKGATGENR